MRDYIPYRGRRNYTGPEHAIRHKGHRGNQANEPPMNTELVGTMALYERAIKNEWPFTDEMRQKIIDEAMRIVESSDKTVHKIAAMKVLAAFDTINQKREAMTQPEQPRVHLNVNVPSVERVDQAFRNLVEVIHGPEGNVPGDGGTQPLDPQEQDPPPQGDRQAT
jgi:hypothetical protein